MKPNKINKPNKTKKSTVKTIIITIIALIILLLLLFAEDIMKLQNKEKIALQENSFETMPTEANVPTLSAGMIPVKWDGTYWVITTQEDHNWYDYTQGKLAYVMLNDGVYQSEPIKDMQDKKLAERHIGVPISENELGTIFAWVPRFTKNTETGEIKYAPTEFEPGGKWKISESFMYQQTDTTKPDFSLAGIWVQKNVDTSYSTKVTGMKKEDGIYGFIANTIPQQTTTEEQETIEYYTENSSVDATLFEDFTSRNRITLKIIDTRKLEPLKANVVHNTEEEKLQIQVTYTTNGISKILDEYGNEMLLTEENGIILADTGNKTLANGTYSFTVIDNKNNRKELSINVSIDSLYKVAYVNGTDNMSNLLTIYNKTQETATSTETTRLNQIQTADTATTYSRAIANSNGTTTAIGETTRTSEDEQMYLYDTYNAVSETKTTWTLASTTSDSLVGKNGTDYARILYFRVCN